MAEQSSLPHERMMFILSQMHFDTDLMNTKVRHSNTSAQDMHVIRLLNWHRLLNTLHDVQSLNCNSLRITYPSTSGFKMSCIARILPGFSALTMTACWTSKNGGAKLTSKRSPYEVRANEHSNAHAYSQNRRPRWQSKITRHRQPVSIRSQRQR